MDAEGTIIDRFVQTASGTPMECPPPRTSDRRFLHSGNHLCNGEPCLDISAYGIEQNQKPVDLFALLDGGYLRYNVLIFCSFYGFTQDLMAFDLTDDGQAVDVSPG